MNVPSGEGCFGKGAVWRYKKGEVWTVCRSRVVRTFGVQPLPSRCSKFRRPRESMMDLVSMGWGCLRQNLIRTHCLRKDNTISTVCKTPKKKKNVAMGQVNLSCLMHFVDRTIDSVPSQFIYFHGKTDCSYKNSLTYSSTVVRTNTT